MKLISLSQENKRLVDIEGSIYYDDGKEEEVESFFDNMQVDTSRKVSLVAYKLRGGAPDLLRGGAPIRNRGKQRALLIVKFEKIVVPVKQVGS